MNLYLITMMVFSFFSILTHVGRLAGAKWAAPTSASSWYDLVIGLCLLVWAAMLYAGAP